MHDCQLITGIGVNGDRPLGQSYVAQHHVIEIFEDDVGDSGVISGSILVVRRTWQRQRCFLNRTRVRGGRGPARWYRRDLRNAQFTGVRRVGRGGELRS